MDGSASGAQGADGPIEGVPQPGERIAGGKYTVEKIVAVGGMGVVLSAMHQQLGQRVAIKFLLPAAVRSDGAVPRFLREARSAARLQNEHVVRIIDVDTLPTGAPFMVMEHLVGADLGQLLELCGVLSLAEAADYVLQACEGIAEAHARGVVHRDLKPSNLFLTQRTDGSALVKVLDFGISKLTRDDGLVPGNLTSTLTVMGSPQYMAPEQIRSSKQVDPRTDIWSLGIILHELLAGSPPFDAQTIPGLCAQISADPPLPVQHARPDVPAAVEEIVLRCLEKDPALRYADVGELARALGPWASEDARPSIARIVNSLAASTHDSGDSVLSRSAPRLLQRARTPSGNRSGTPPGRSDGSMDETVLRESLPLPGRPPSGDLPATMTSPLSVSPGGARPASHPSIEPPILEPAPLSAATSPLVPRHRERPLWSVAVLGLILAGALIALVIWQSATPTHTRPEPRAATPRAATVHGAKAPPVPAPRPAAPRTSPGEPTVAPLPAAEPHPVGWTAAAPAPEQAPAKRVARPIKRRPAAPDHQGSPDMDIRLER
jgi:eukaryotic-like serine/threonine-protein kinase